MSTSWKNVLSEEFEKEYFKNLLSFVEQEYKNFPNQIFPEEKAIFKAFDECSFEDVKVVILGQDPYPTKGHANGLSFSLNADVQPLAKSLKNIFKELESDLGIQEARNGDLSRWAKQGVLLLNSVLTVREGEANSHANKGWELFTDAVIAKLNSQRSHIVYILWGAKSQKKAKNVNGENNLIIKSPHPSPLSSYRGFFGSQPFSLTNTYLAKNQLEKIDW